MKTLGELLDYGKRELLFLGEKEAAANTECLLVEVTGLERTFLYLDRLKEIPESDYQRFESLVQARKKRIPLQYILGKAFFWNEVLEVNPNCLVPRPETEILIECFIEKSGLSQKDSFCFLDLGSGSGAIGIALLRHYPQAQCTFSDISDAALEVTRKNVEKYGLQARSELVLGDLFKGFHGRTFFWKAIFSNPPYFAAGDWSRVEPEILQEPREALDGGEDGLVYYRRIAAEAGLFLQESGWLVLEIGQGQANDVDAILRRHAFTRTQCYRDYSNIDRVVMARQDTDTNG